MIVRRVGNRREPPSRIELDAQHVEEPVADPVHGAEIRLVSRRDGGVTTVEDRQTIVKRGGIANPGIPVESRDKTPGSVTPANDDEHVGWIADRQVGMNYGVQHGERRRAETQCDTQRNHRDHDERGTPAERSDGVTKIVHVVRARAAVLPM